MNIDNAIIKSYKIYLTSFDHLSLEIVLDYGMSTQVFGNYVLYTDGTLDTYPNVCGFFIKKLLDVTASRNLNEIVGKSVRANHDIHQVFGIGHIIKDIWLTPKHDFAQLLASWKIKE